MTVMAYSFFFWNLPECLFWKSSIWFHKKQPKIDSPISHSILARRTEEFCTNGKHKLLKIKSNLIYQFKFCQLQYWRDKCISSVAGKNKFKKKRNNQLFFGFGVIVIYVLIWKVRFDVCKHILFYFMIHRLF